jgi:hypothetical protein
MINGYCSNDICILKGVSNLQINKTHEMAEIYGDLDEKICTRPVKTLKNGHI